MPTKAFFNLDIQKQTRLLDAAKHEFSQNLFENTSINKIIKNIDMPRGSFYLYFNNKEDIYLYIVESYLKKFKKILFEILEQNNHDIFESIICLYDYILENKNIDHELVTNIFLNMDSKQLELAIPELLKKEVDGYIIGSINFDDYILDEEDKTVVMSIIFTLLFTNITKSLSNTCANKKVREFYISQINIIKKGLERR